MEISADTSFDTFFDPSYLPIIILDNKRIFLPKQNRYLEPSIMIHRNQPKCTSLSGFDTSNQKIYPLNLLVWSI